MQDSRRTDRFPDHLHLLTMLYPLQSISRDLWYLQGGWAVTSQATGLTISHPVYGQNPINRSITRSRMQSFKEVHTRQDHSSTTKTLSQAPQIAVHSQGSYSWGAALAPISPWMSTLRPPVSPHFLSKELPDQSRYFSVSESTSAGHVPSYVVVAESRPQITGSMVDEDSMRDDKNRLLNRLMAQLITMLSTRFCREDTDGNGSDVAGDTSGEDESSNRWHNTCDSDAMSTASGCTAPYDQDSSSQGPSQSRSSTTAASTSSDSRYPQINSNGKHPKLQNEEDEDHNDEGDAPRKRSKPNPNLCLADPDPRKFACPFFQRNPERHTGRRSCIGPGFTTVHRVK
jgi:hypothetical protein